MRFEAGASTRATPVVKDGLMFIGAGTRLYALDAATGERVWVLRPDEDAPEDLESARIGEVLNAGRGIPAPPGVALGDGLVFVGLMDGRLAAVDQKTGASVWTTQVGYDPPKRGQAVSGAPIYAEGTVFVGLANGDWAFRGKVLALDAKTGELLWEFYTIPGLGEPGSATWPQEGRWADVWEQGGAGVWHIGNVDVELGLVYFVTGNAVPMFGGEARKGDNLYTASILALDVRTGELRWHYQVVHHDLWDADIAIAPLLYDAAVDGQPRKALAALRADGYFFLLDRETGEPIHPVEERPVTQQAATRLTASSTSRWRWVPSCGPSSSAERPSRRPRHRCRPAGGQRVAWSTRSRRRRSCRAPSGGVGLRYAVDEHAFNPSRASVKAGTILTFVNSGMMTHTVSAHDASWSTGPLKLAESGYVRFDVRVYTYHCEDHPWAMGQITVVP